jgi:hypothetical protein
MVVERRKTGVGQHLSLGFKKQQNVEITCLTAKYRRFAEVDSKLYD